MDDKDKRVVGSMDVTALYVQVQPRRAAEEIMSEIIESDYTISHNIEECVKFVAVNLNRSEICREELHDVIKTTISIV